MLYVLIWLACGVAAAMIYSGKGRSGGAAFLLGLFLGPIGVLLAALTPADPAGQEAKALQGGTMKKCPNCAELVKAEAAVCRFCNHQFVTAPIVVPDGKATKVMKPGGAACSACDGYVRYDATLCKHCKREFVSA